MHAWPLMLCAGRRMPKHTEGSSRHRSTHLMPGIFVATDPAHRFCTRTPNCAYSAFTDTDKLSKNRLLAPYADQSAGGSMGNAKS